MNPLESELTALLNRHSIGNASDTPDYILAGYMLDCLRAFNDAVNIRERWYGRSKPADTGIEP